MKPLYEAVSKFLPLLDLSPLEKNKEKWAGLIDYYEEELAKLKRESELMDIEKPWWNDEVWIVMIYLYM